MHVCLEMSPGNDEWHKRKRSYDNCWSEIMSANASSEETTEHQIRYAATELPCRRELSRLAALPSQDKALMSCTRTKLAVVLRIQGMFPEAEALHRIVLDDMLELCGEAHPFILASSSNLAVVLRYQKRYQEAETFQRRAYEGCIVSFGPRDQRTLVCQHNLALLCQNLGKAEDARELMLRVLHECKRNDVEPKVELAGLATASTIAMSWILQCQGDNEEAARYYMEAHRLMTDVRIIKHRVALACWKLSLSLRTGHGK